jgi:DNA-binding SARP family transcriptional activator/Tfp pilus assembly protein PilF
VEFRLLGPLELAQGDVIVAPERPQERALLAFLLLHPNEPIPTDVLLEHLWPARGPSAAKRSLQVHVSRLRPLLDLDGGAPRLERASRGYLLRVGPGELDLDCFERTITSGRAALDRGDPVEAAIVLRDALALWRGAPLVDVAYEAFAQPEIARLEELRLVAISARIEADLRLGRHEHVIPELRTLVAGEAAHERFSELLMLALYRSGRHEEALGVYHSSPRVRDFEPAILTREGPTRDTEGSGRLRRGPQLGFAESAAHIAELAEAAGPQLRGPEQARWLQTLDDEETAIRAACWWALNTRVPAFVLDIGAALWPYWESRRSIDEARALLDAAIASADPGAGARARALVAVGRIALRQGDLAHARRSFAAALPSLRTTRDLAGFALAKSGLAWVALGRREYDVAAQLARQAVAPAWKLDEPWIEGDVLNTLGTASRLRGDFDGANVALQKSLALRRRAADLEGVAATLGSLAWLDVAQRDFDSAEAHLRQALAVSLDRDDRWFATAVDLSHAYVALARGDLVTARQRAVVGLRACSLLGTVRLSSAGLRILAAVEAGSGAAGGAAILAGAAAVSGPPHDSGASRTAVDYGWETVAVDAALEGVRDRMGPVEWAQLTARGTTLSEQELAELLLA